MRNLNRRGLILQGCVNRMFGLRQVVPLEFAAQKIEVVVTNRMKHGETFFAHLDAQNVSRLHVNENLSVETRNCAAGFVYLNVDFGVRAQYDRAVGESVRRNRDQEHA